MDLNPTIQVQTHAWNHYCGQEPVAKPRHNINSHREEPALLLNGHSTSLTPNDLSVVPVD